MTHPNPLRLPGRHQAARPVGQSRQPSVLTLFDRYRAAQAQSASIAAQAEAAAARDQTAAAAELQLDLRMARAEATRLACDILEAAPAGAANALAKIEFLAALLDDGGAIGPGRLARLLRESAAICAEEMRPPWQIGQTGQPGQPGRRRH